MLAFQNGINAAADKYGSGIKYISVSDILNSSYITYDTIKGMIDIDDHTLDNFAVNYGDILFQRSSETQEDIGRSNVYLDSKTATFGGFVIRGRKIGEYNPIFFKHLLDTQTARKVITRLGAGAQHYNIGQDSLRTVQLCFPKIKEQDRISELLLLIDEKISLYKKYIELLKSYKRGVLLHVFSEIDSTVPLYEVSDYFSSSNTMATIESRGEGIYPVYDAGGIIVHIGTYDFDNPYIAIIKDGSGVGRLQQCQSHSSIIGTLGALVPKDCTVDYLYAALQTVDFRQFTTGMAIPHIYYKDYKNIAIPYPNKETQRSIENIAKNFDEILLRENALLLRLQQQKAALLQQLFI